MGRKTAEVKSRSHPAVSRAPRCWCWPWPPGLRQCLSGFSTIKLFFLTFLFHAVHFGKKLLCAATLEWELCSASLRTDCPHTVFLNSAQKIDLVSPYLFTYSIIYCHHHGLMDVYFILYKIIIQYYFIFFFFSLNCASSGQVEFFQLDLGSLWHSPIIMGSVFWLRFVLFLFLLLSCFLALQDAPGLSCRCHAQSCESWSQSFPQVLLPFIREFY